MYVRANRGRVVYWKFANTQAQQQLSQQTTNAPPIDNEWTNLCVHFIVSYTEHDILDLIISVSL